MHNDKLVAWTWKLASGKDPVADIWVTESSPFFSPSFVYVCVFPLSTPTIELLTLHGMCVNRTWRVFLASLNYVELRQWATRLKWCISNIKEVVGVKTHSESGAAKGVGGRKMAVVISEKGFESLPVSNTNRKLWLLTVRLKLTVANNEVHLLYATRC